MTSSGLNTFLYFFMEIKFMKKNSICYHSDPCTIIFMHLQCIIKRSFFCHLKQFGGSTLDGTIVLIFEHCWQRPLASGLNELLIGLIQRFMIMPFLGLYMFSFHHFILLMLEHSKYFQKLT